MSLTQVYTETKDGRTTSRGSIPLRARSPHPPAKDESNDRKSFERADEIELAQLDGSGREVDPNASGTTTGKGSPNPDDEPPKVSKWNAHLQYGALLFTLFLAGWNDGTTGPLLPRIQSNYHVSIWRTPRIVMEI